MSDLFHLLDGSYHVGHYPFSAGFKVSGTSQEAAESVSKGLKESHKKLIALLKHHPRGLTADGAGNLLGWPPFYSRPRMTELHKRRLVKAIGRATNSSGKAANVWGLA